MEHIYQVQVIKISLRPHCLSVGWLSYQAVQIEVAGGLEFELATQWLKRLHVSTDKSLTD